MLRAFKKRPKDLREGGDKANCRRGPLLLTRAESWQVGAFFDMQRFDSIGPEHTRSDATEKEPERLILHARSRIDRHAPALKVERAIDEKAR